MMRTISQWYKHFGVDHIFYDIKIQQNGKDREISKIDFDSLEKLRDFIMKIDICGLKKIARNTVFSDGDPSSEIMIIGEAPGEDEDIQGKPFVGQSGQLLNNMLRSVGIDRKNVYVSNIIFWRPPGNRNPSSEEIAKCMPYVKCHIKLINPKVILLLGGVAAKSIFNTNDSVTSMRGKNMEYEGIKTVITFHPAYLLRSPEQKTLAFLDMIKLKKIIL
ncbi:MAG: uracil-DNA glycosylase [Holosporales bacterium]|jgi:DNA polymerase|nr:uracil-DNA glycosylase [Holosporales bacterium]